MTELFEETTRHVWPQPTLMSIYNFYPNKQDRATSLKRIREALDRIVAGEIDGNPREPAEAVRFLREATNVARVFYLGRNRSFIPHSTTWYNQSRYLRPTIEDTQDLPEDLENCITILSRYPNIASGESAIRANAVAFLPALKAISEALKVLPYSQLLQRVKIYAECIEEWPKEERRYVPNAERWFREHRFNQKESQWRRQSRGNYQTERDQVRRVLNS